nr:hypothetical protein [Tanacetum cinerariifolium]
MEESDSKDLNKEIEGENNEDEIRVATESENEEIIDEKTKRTKKYRKKKETRNTKGKRTMKIEEEDMKSNEKDEVSNSENEVLSVVKGKKRETMKKKTKDSNPKEKKLRNNTSNKKLEHYDDEEKNQNGNKSKVFGKSRTPCHKGDGVTKFKDDQMMFDICKQYKEMFNDAEFNLYESSKDEDSDNDSDPDNDNNKDDEEELKADGKNQNENERQSEIQKEKENIEDMGKGTEEGGSDANDNGEKDEDDVNIENEFEKVNEKDDEEAVLMDVDDPNEKIKEKEANKEKVSDSIKKEQQVRSEKEKQYEADKVEKVQEIQDEHNRLTHDQFWDKEYDLTDSQYKELEIRATQDIKKKQTPKRKSIVDMTPSLFSLGLSLTKNESKSKNKEEKRLCFETKDGAATIMDYMQTLAPQLKVESNFIDTFSIVLNHEQKMNSKGKKIKYFFHTCVITKDMFKWKKANEEYDEEKKFEAFSNKIMSEFKKDPEIKNMKDLEMGNTVIIDNSKTQMTYDAKYKTVCELLKKLFYMHLEKVEHPRAKNVLNKKPTILRPK